MRIPPLIVNKNTCLIILPAKGGETKVHRPVPFFDERAGGSVKPLIDPGRIKQPPSHL